MMRAPIPATPVSNMDALFTEEAPPGAFLVRPENRSLMFLCPCGCGNMHDLPTYPRGTIKPPSRPGHGASWEFNGDGQRPTLSPSIRDVAACRFHGWLEAGIWRFEADSGVRPAGE